MMSGSVEGWLQTFLCSQYTRTFEAHGYKTLHSVCHLQLPHLLAMGVPRNHCEKILENVNNLRQTMFGQIPKPSDSNIYHYNKYNPAVWALKTVAMNANYRGMNQYPDEYSGYGHGQSGNSMQAMGFHQGNYENASMAMMNPMSGAGSGGYPVPGYDASQSHMMMASQGQMSAHSAMYQQQSQQQAYMAQQQQQQQQQQYYASSGGGGGGSSTGGQYSGQTYPMQGSTSMPSLGGGNQYYNTGSGQSHSTSASKMVPPPHHHLRNTSGQQNPQQVADNILQLASSFPSHHTVQVPLKNRHAPYQIPRSPQNYYPEKGGSQQQGMGIQCQQQAMPTPQGMQQAMSTGPLQTKTSQPQVHMVQAPGMGQPAAMMYAGSSPQSQPPLPPRSSPMSPMMMASPAAGLQAQSLSSPSAMHSPTSTAVCSPMPSSPGLANMRSPCSVPMRSPAHMASGYSGHPISSPPQRPFTASESSAAAAQHRSPTSMHSPASHGSSPYTPAGLAHHVSSPPQSHAYSAPAHSPYKLDMLMDSGQGPGLQGSQGPRGQGSDPLQSLQKLVMLPEKQVVDPKSVVSDGCLQNCDEGSKNSEGPAEQSREAVDCSAGVVVTFNPPAAGDPSDTNSFHGNTPAESGSPCCQSGSSSASTGQGDGDRAPTAAANSTNTVNESVACSMSPPTSQQGVQSAVPATSDQNAVCSSSPENESHEPDANQKSTVPNADIKNVSPKCCSSNSPDLETKVDVPESKIDVPETTAAGSSETEDNIACSTTKLEESSPTHCNGLVTPADSKTDIVNAELSNVSDSTARLVSDCQKTITDVKPDVPEKADEKVQNGSPRSREDTLTTKTVPKPSPPKKRYSQRLSQASSTKPFVDLSLVKAESRTTKSDAESNTAAKSKPGLQPLDTTSKAKIVNGFSEKHENTTDADLPVTSKRHLPKKNHVHYKSPDKEQTNNCLGLAEEVPEPKQAIKHKSRDLVPTRVACMVTATSGPDSKDLLTLYNTDLGESDSEVAGQSDSIVPDHGSGISGGGVSSSTEHASHHLDSDNEDDSFSNELDFGYDSPPCEMLGDDGWKPDLEKRLSTNGVDEADGSENCTENDGDKSANLKTKGSYNSSPAKANPSPAPATRIVTRSATGRAPKRKWEEASTTHTKKTRQNSGVSYKQNDTMSLSMECDEIDTKESFSDVEVISSSDESGKDRSTKNKKLEDRSAESGNQNFSEKNCQRTPVVVLTKPSSRRSQANQRSEQKPKVASDANSRQSSSHFYSVRGEKGRFVARQQVDNATTRVSSSVNSSSVPGVRRERGRLLTRQQANGAAASDPISIDSNSDNEPRILVRRRASKGEEGNSVMVSSSEPDREKSKSVQQMAKSELTVMHGASKLHSKSFFSSIPPENTPNPSLQTPGPSKSTSPARSDSSTPKRKSKPKKKEASPVANRKKSSKSKKKSKHFHRLDSADDTFKSMKFSRTLNHLQNKKKGEHLQAVKSFSPFVRVEGKRMMPSSVSVFNHPPADTKDLKCANKRKNMSSAAAPTTVEVTNFPSDKTVMLPSTKTTEASWVCALCGKRSSYRFLGDLFGPYFLESHLSSLSKSALAQSKKDSKPEPTSSSEAGSAHNTRRKSLGCHRTSSVEETVTIPQEVWIHEDCAMWSSGVYVVGSRVYGLEEALKAATATLCACCREKGAMIGCLHKGCNQNFHYMCAVDKMCFLDVENLCMLCPKHKDKRMKSAAASTSRS